MMNLVSRCSERTPDVLASTASESPVKTRHESQCRRLKINIKRSSVHIRESHVCANKLDVQETDFRFTHSSMEARIISLDAGLRMDGIPALDLWDLVIEVFHSSPNQTNKTKDVREPRGKPVGRHSTQRAKTDSNHAHQSRSDQY